MPKNSRIKLYGTILILFLFCNYIFNFNNLKIETNSSNNTYKFQLVSNNINSASWPPPEETIDNYAAALQKSIYFYMQQRSGNLTDNNPVIWKGDSCLNDGIDSGLDLTGGYYDGSGSNKFGLPMASTIATLAWSVYEYYSVFENIDQLDEILDAIKWGTDYFIKANPNPNEFYFQVGDPVSDASWWGPSEVIEEVMSRSSYRVTSSQGGSAVCGATAAALTLASIIFNNSDPTYADICLTHAIQLNNLAWAAQSDSFYNSIAGAYYESENGFWDELSACGVLLYIKTGNTTYLDKSEQAAANWAIEEYETEIKYQTTHCWNDMHYMAQILLSRVSTNQTYIDSIERNLDWWMPGGGIDYTPGGLAWLASLGSLRYAANAAFLAFVWADSPNCTTSKASIYHNFAEEQIKYILGDNPRSSSYLVGFGPNSPQNPRHETAHGSWANLPNLPADNRHILYGALVSGPDMSDSWTDDRLTLERTSIACDYNSGLIGALAKMTDLYGGTPHNDFPGPSWFKPKNMSLIEIYSDARLTIDGTAWTEISVDLANHATWPARVTDQLSYRYYFNISEIYSWGYTSNDITVTSIWTEPGAIINIPEIIHLENDIYYVEVDYKGTILYPAGEVECAKETQIRIGLPDASPDEAWNPTNDWSFQSLNSTRFPNKYIPVYDNGIWIYGLDPQMYTNSPAAPTGLTANTLDSTNIKLSWNDNIEPDFDKYSIYRSNTPSFTPDITNFIANTSLSQYFDTELTPSTTYYYQLIAIDIYGNPSVSSMEESATTTKDTNPPLAPIGLIIEKINPTSIYIDWSDNIEPDIEKYSIYRSITPGFMPDSTNFIINTSISQYFDTGLTPDTTYYYVIIAIDIYNNPSGPSLEVSAKTLNDDTKINDSLFIISLIIILSLIGISVVTLYLTEVKRSKLNKKNTTPNKIKEIQSKKRVKIKNKPLEKRYWKLKTTEVVSVDDIFKDIQLNDLLNENNIIDKVTKLKGMEITLLEEDFFEKIELLEWKDETEKFLFIKEMISLTPEERKRIFNHMLDNLNS